MAAVGVASLVLTPLVAVTPAAALMSDGPVFISEIHYDNAGEDTGEAIEVQAPAGTDLTGWQIVLYNGSGGTAYDTKVLDGVVGDAGVLVQEYPPNGIQNGAPDGVALVDPGGTVVELLSYEGVLTAADGPAAAMTSTDIGVAQANAPAGQSLQRLDGEWTGPVPSSFGAVNTPPPPPPDPVDATIAQIQGTGDATPYLGLPVTTRGVVTAVYPEGGFNGAYIQTEGTGGDLEGHDASHGIFVFGGSTGFAAAVEIGDHVQVTGTAGEYNGLTQLSDPEWNLLEAPFEQPKAAAIAFPATDAERERFEGMLVEPQGGYVVTDTYSTNRYGSIGLAAGDELLRQPTDVGRPGSEEAAAAVADRAARAVTLDDGSSWEYTRFDNGTHESPLPYLSTTAPVRVGAEVTFTEPVILDYRFQWNFQPTTQVTGANDESPATFENTRTAGPEPVGGDTTIASFNVLNYFTTLGTDVGCTSTYDDREGNPVTNNRCDPRGAYDADSFARQEAKIVAAITALDADVVALEEIENSRHFTENGDRDVALGRLVEALNTEAGAPVWAFVPSPTTVPEDEDVIRNAFIYQRDAVTPVGESRILDVPAFDNAREPLAQHFAPVDGEGEVVEGAETFVAITNHFKSKGSGEGENADQGDGQGASNPDRIRQAQALAAFADELVAELGTENVFLLGDFNSYTEEDPMHVLYGAGYTNIAQELTDESTYLFDGVVGSLDHVLGNEAAMGLVTGADVWNVNAYESIALEYSRFNYNVTNLYDESQYRSSDHDPVIVGLDLAQDVNPGTVDINLLAFNDFHGRLFDYTRDEEGNATGNATVSFAGTIEELRAEEGEDRTILFSSGDNIGASLFTSSLQQDEPTIEILNALDLGATAVGNHEFDRGWDVLRGEVSDLADFPHLGANVYLRGTDEPALPEYELFEVDGVTVAVIGVVTKSTETLVSPDGIADLTFGDPVDAVNRVADELTDGEGDEADVIVASFHEGADDVAADATLEAEMAESEVFTKIVDGTSPEVDAIFNGHTHELYAWDAPVPGQDGAFRPVISGNSYGSHVSQVVLTVDGGSGDVIDYSARNVPLTSTPMTELLETYPRVAAVQEVLDPALEQARIEGGKVVGEITADITTAFTERGRDDRGSESTLGNLVGNALLNRLSDPARGGAQIGVVNPGGLRAELLYESEGDEEDGEVTFAEANAVLPFLNDLWTLTFTGDQFVEMLEQQWRPNGSRLHLGLSDNVSYTYDPDAPAGERITSVTIDGEPISATQEYRIGTFSFLAQGGDSFTVFDEATDVRESGLIDRDAWIDYIGTNSPLSPSFDRRSTVVTPLPSELTAGQRVSFEVSRLDLTSLGSPENTELAVYLVGADGERGTPVHTAPVTDGAATVTFTVPAGLDGEYTLEMEAAPSGTTIRVPVTVAGVTGPAPEPRYGFFLTNGWAGGVADRAFMFGRFTDEVLVGDWDGDGRDSIAVRRGNQFFVSNAPRGGAAETTFTYGRPGDAVLVGDWDGDGEDTLAVRRGRELHVRNSLAGGPADRVVAYGRPDDEVLVGDWDGNGRDTFAVRRGTTFYVKNTIAGGTADVTFAYGRLGDEVLTGDWDGDGEDTFAVRRGRTYYVNNALRGGEASRVMAYGRESDEAFVGDWDGDGRDTIGLRRAP